ncbi:glycosyltransferase [Chiayiivirga flava]|uniref:Glycosyltransferase involved in cell wall biosynthesis n=1 Tax=Chiayiivirga flava TaxID=659595 RepID=A0A7W8D3L8_9GAMM|nr:glycosyltransferase [Chiayiivirga flava]MBB5207328.1 glycosyltransferase involved in cell wall biosynthesis [Chiayiivirga flava]
MRILHLGKFYPPHAGGIERFVAELAAAQRSAGHAVAALVHASPGVATPTRRVDADGVEVHAVPCHGQLLFAPVSPGWAVHFRRLMDEFRPDLLHVHVPNVSAFWLLASRRARRVPWVLHWHADIPADSGQIALRLGYPLYRQFERRLVERADVAVATSHAYAQASVPLRSHARRVAVVPLGMGDAPAPGIAPAWPGAGLRLLAVGRLSYYKGFEILLRALSDVPDASLLLVGAGDGAAGLQATVQALGLQARVRLAGHLDDAALEAAYRACDVFCLPSLDRAEAFGMVLLEAMRAGKPIVASDIPGSGVGTVAGPDNALRVAPGDAGALADAIRTLAESAALRERLGTSGRLRWEREYRIGAVSAAMDAVYRSVCSGHATAG